MTKCKGRISSTESFGSVDGPGLRYVIFLQGCNLRCLYCHNPETWSLTGGFEESAKRVFAKAWRYRAYWKNDGGITVSGGEPLLQLEFLVELFTLAKAKGISTVVDTAGEPFSYKEPFYQQFAKLVDLTDIFLLDIKHINSDKYREMTGKGNENTLELAKYLSDNGKRMWIRHVLVPNWTDNEADLRELATFIKTLKTVEKVEVLPYHTMAIHKYEDMGMNYKLTDVLPPTKEQLERACKILSIE